jgi:hypothetical protein
LENGIKIIKIVLNKFDQDTLNQQLGKSKDLPVKLFVNCKNSKKKAVEKPVA